MEQKEERKKYNTKNFVGFLEYLDYAGHAYQEVKNEPGQYQLVDHKSLRINPQRNQWNYFSHQVGGGIRKFMAEIDGITDGREQLETFKKIQQARGKDWKSPEFSNVSYEPKKFEPNDHHFVSEKQMHSSLKFLHNVRGIHPFITGKLVQAGLIKQEMKEISKGEGRGSYKIPNLVFPWYNKDHELVGEDVQAVRPRRGSDDQKHGGYFKGIATGSPSKKENYNFSIGSKGKPAEELYLFEAPLDAISYWQLNYNKLKDKSVMFASMSGVNVESFKSLIQDRYIHFDDKELYMPKEIHFAMDNDVAGRGFGEAAANWIFELKEKFNGMDDVHMTLDLPTDQRYKDWNDILRYGDYDITQISVEGQGIQIFDDELTMFKENIENPKQLNQDRTQQATLVEEAIEPILNINENEVETEEVEFEEVYQPKELSYSR